MRGIDDVSGLTPRTRARGWDTPQKSKEGQDLDGDVVCAVFSTRRLEFLFVRDPKDSL